MFESKNTICRVVARRQPGAVSAKVLIAAVLLLAILVVPAAAEQSQSEDDQKLADADKVRFFEKQVKPILAVNCFKCHGASAKVKGGLRLTSRAGVLKGGETRSAVDLKQPDKSLLLDAINYKTYEMPPKGKLPRAKIDILTRWVKMGLPWTPGDPKVTDAPVKHGPPQVNAETKNFWSFRPISQPAVPDVQLKNWITNPIDAFVLAKLEAAGLKPVAPANKIVLLRRASYDLTGLPPSLRDVEEFLADNSAGAYDQVVDRLLKSLQYGERWGRHWLDLVRYAESNSYERDGTKPHIWRYRDYVIKSFNEDKPYTQFIREQLAGDEFEPKTPDSIVATGYYRLGIWDDEPVSQKQALYDDLDDILLTTSQVFLGLTMNCARCHDHKIDPIPQKDYYRFLAFFNGIRRYGVRSFNTVADASIGPIAVGVTQEQQAVLRKRLDGELGGLNRKIDSVNRRLQGLMTPAEKQDFRAVEVRVDLARKYVGKGLSKQLVAEYVKSVARKKVIEQTRPAELAKALIVKEVGAKARDTFVLVRGNANVQGDKVEPGFPSVLSPPKPVISVPKLGKSSGHRTALANWIASPDNPLTARVIVNRLWQHHFGRGIVRSSNNFGDIGDRPTHPRLLDWLAKRLIADGWKLKAMHKLMLMSSAYRMSSQDDARGLAEDPANNLLWRFKMRRLCAEELRDSVLAANGSLNLKMGGPSFYPIIPKEVLAGQSRPGNGWGNSSAEERARRAIYIFIKRSLVEPMLADFDFADVDSTCPVRFVTNQPTQALGLLNSEFMNRQAGVFADYLKKTAGVKTADQVALCLERVCQRKPKQHEIDRGVALIESLKKENIPEHTVLKYFCLVSYNLNEFLYLD